MPGRSLQRGAAGGGTGCRGLEHAEQQVWMGELDARRGSCNAGSQRLASQQAQPAHTCGVQLAGPPGYLVAGQGREATPRGCRPLRSSMTCRRGQWVGG